MGIRLFGACLVLMATAVPAVAQDGPVLTGSCQPHKGGSEIRCAYTYVIQGERNLMPRLTLGSRRAGITGQATFWISECGAQGRQVSQHPILSETSRIEFQSTPIGARVGPPKAMCPEVFVTDCRADNSRVNCAVVMPPTSLVYEVRVR